MTEYSRDNNKQKELWAADRKQHGLRYPDENVIRFLKRTFEDGSGVRLMDFGCGSGRNETVMMDMGFEIYAVDYNEKCLNMTREVAEERKYNKIRYILNDKTDIPVDDGVIDCFVSLGGLFYFNREERDRFWSEMHRILRRGGVVFADFRAVDDSMYGKGIKLEKDFYCLEDSGSLSGINYWFCDEKTLRDLFSDHGFTIYNLEKRDYYRDNMNRRNSHYFVYARKE